ncbi:MAG: alpha/beta hydrolase [Rubrobacter sp.]|nr:alpha/beta hydrolase [Rubrobacter sp.]
MPRQVLTDHEVPVVRLPGGTPRLAESLVRPTAPSSSDLSPDVHNDAPPTGTDLATEPPRIGPGAGSFRFVDGLSGERKPLTVWYYRPPRLPAAAPVVFVMHGVKRDADNYRDTWMAAAELFGFLLLCPKFAKKDYPRSAYQLGNLADSAGRPLPQDEWTFNVIEHLFDFVKETTGNTSERYHIYGHSAGGQFVHRLALFMPEARYETAITANAGWYTMPTFAGSKFPYGLKGSAGTPETLKKAFGRRLVILLGERDTDADDPHLRKSTATSRQGANRFERGQAFHATAREEAESLGVTLNWRLHTVPGAAHLQQQMMPAAARAIFANDERLRQEPASPAETAPSSTQALLRRALARFDPRNIGRKR